MNRNEYVFGKDCGKEHPCVYCRIERITPDVAVQMLECNVKNRNVSDFTVERYAKDMQWGDWQLTGGAIVFNTQGQLDDGQHRLLACVRSGVPFDTVVIRGTEPKAQDMMDGGRKRSNADVLAIRGEKNYTALATAAGVIAAAREYGFDAAFRKGRNYSVTRAEVLREAMGKEELKTCVHACVTESVKKAYSCGDMAALYYVFRKIDRDDADFFLADFSKSVPTRQPVQLLKNTLITDKANKKQKLGRDTKAAFAIKAWNAFRNGEEPAFLRWTRGGAHPESFPWPDGLDEREWGSGIREGTR